MRVAEVRVAVFVQRVAVLAEVARIGGPGLEVEVGDRPEGAGLGPDRAGGPGRPAWPAAVGLPQFTGIAAVVGDEIQGEAQDLGFAGVGIALCPPAPERGSARGCA
jgi:hypothetical protein